VSFRKISSNPADDTTHDTVLKWSRRPATCGLILALIPCSNAVPFACQRVSRRRRQQQQKSREKDSLCLLALHGLFQKETGLSGSRKRNRE
jgi:hypothetical protein